MALDSSPACTYALPSRLRHPTSLGVVSRISRLRLIACGQSWLMAAWMACLSNNSVVLDMVFSVRVTFYMQLMATVKRGILPETCKAPKRHNVRT